MNQNGHCTLMETNAGLGSGFDGDAYTGAGAGTIETSEGICERCGKYGEEAFLLFHVLPDEGKEKG